MTNLLNQEARGFAAGSVIENVEHEVQDHQIRRSAAHRVQGLPARRSRLDLETSLGEIHPNQLQEVRLVVHHQDSSSHARKMISAPTRAGNSEAISSEDRHGFATNL